MMAEEAEAKKKKLGLSLLKSRTAMIVMGVTILEGGFFFAATKIFGGGPQVAQGVEGEHLLEGDPGEDVTATAEVEVLHGFRSPNNKKGRAYIYELDVIVKVPGHRKEEIEELVAERSGEIEDRISRIVRAADPAILNEPELKTLRMQIRRTVGEIARDQDVILEVLLPRCVPHRAD